MSVSAQADAVRISRAPHLASVRPAAGPPAVAPLAQPVDAGQFRQALGQHPAGVAIITLAGPAGLTVTSFSSASLEPPLVSFYIGHGSSNWPAVQQARHFAVNLMGHGHQDTASLFARKGADRFGPATEWRTGPLGLPLLEGATVHLICATTSLVPVGDHELVVGRVLQADLNQSAPPLLHHRGQFTRPESA